MFADDDVAAHAAGEIHDDIDFAFADALDDFAVVLGLHAERARFRFAHVDVNDGGAGLGGGDGGGCDLFGVTAQCGLLVTLLSSPVTAQEMMTS